jgi:APA family basic amino acid/polyamine antiporter
LFLVLISVFTLFVPARVAGELTSIGTLLAFVIVCTGIWVMRKKMPDAPRVFKTPLVPLVPILGIATCLFMMAFLPFDTWVRLILWMLVGHDIYVFYSSRHSKLRSNGSLSRKENRSLSFIGLGIATVLAFFTIANQLSESWKDIVFPLILLSISGIHILLYSIRLIRNN